MKRLSLLLAIAALAAAAVPAGASAQSAACDPIDPAVCLLPFPNDFFTVADASTPTGRRVNLPQDGMPKNRFGKPIDVTDLNRADGFSPGQAIITKVPGLEGLKAYRNSNLPPIDDPARSLDDDSPVVVVNERTGERQMVWAEVDMTAANPGDRVLIIRPAKNFTEGDRYVVGLRNLRDRYDRPIRAGAAFRRYRDGDADDARAADMNRIFRTLYRAGVKRRDLYLAWDFTVASAKSTTGRMLSIRDRAFQALGDTNLADGEVQGDVPTYTINPDLPDDLDTPPQTPSLPELGRPSLREADGIIDYPDGPIARKVQGKITVPCFLNAPGCPTGSQFLIGADGNPVQIPGNTTVYDFTCNIPRRAGKLRMSLYGHGLFGSQGEIDQGQLKDMSIEYGFMFCAVDWNGMAFKDIPNAVTVLQDVSRFPTLVDHVQQGYLGFLYLGRAMIHPDGFSRDPAFQPPANSPVKWQLDPSALYYDGNSQGGIYGGALTAIAPDFRRAALGVPGMNYSTLLSRSTDFDTYANGEIGTDTPFGLYDNYPNERERQLLFGLMQMLWDRADPNGYAAHMTSDPLPNTPSHKVLLQVGFGDHQVADVSAEVQARTIGARIHQPALAADRPRFRDRPYPDRPSQPFYGVGSLGESYDGSGVVFWDTHRTPPAPASNVPNRQGQDPHEYPRRTPAARLQKSEFLKPDGRIVDVCGGKPCHAS